MIAVRDKSTNEIVHVTDQKRVFLTDRYFKDGNILSVNFNSLTHELIRNYKVSVHHHDEKTRLKAEVVEIMAEKQDGGVIFNGVLVATDGDAVADLSGEKHSPATGLKIVPRHGRGVKFELTTVAQFNTLFNAVKAYRKNVMAHAYDLLDNIENDVQVDIHNGWPIA